MSYLDSLPRTSVVMDPHKNVYQKRGHVQEGFKVAGWFHASDCEYAHEADEIELPVSILYDPRDSS